MNEYEHLKKQKDEMLAKHREPGTKCPFGCPHESDARLREELAAAKKSAESWKSEVARQNEHAATRAGENIRLGSERDEARAKLAAMEARVVELEELNRVLGDMAYKLPGQIALLVGAANQILASKIAVLTPRHRRELIAALPRTPSPRPTEGKPAEKCGTCNADACSQIGCGQCCECGEPLSSPAPEPKAEEKP